MSIWFKPYTISQLNDGSKGSLLEQLGIQFTEIGDDYLEGTMPVDARTIQPAGILHGGASVALAESLASTAGNLTLDPDLQMCVGLEINANHIRACRNGFVTGRTSSLHIGKTTQVWEIKITQKNHLVCMSRITLSVLKQRK